MKDWFTSKTILVNILLAVLVVVQLALDQAWIPAEFQVLVVTVVNAFLRFVSSEAVTIPFLRPKE